MPPLTSSPAWKALQDHHAAMASIRMRELFARDPDRFSRYSLRIGNLLIDFAKHIVTDETVQHLVALARQEEVELWRDRMFRGEKINFTEGRAVYHVLSGRVYSGV